MDYVTGRGFERNSGTQAYSSLRGYQRDTHATPGFCRWQTPVVVGTQHISAPVEGSAAGRLQVGVSVELALVEPLQHLALGDGHAPVPDGALVISRQGR